MKGNQTSTSAARTPRTDLRSLLRPRLRTLCIVAVLGSFGAGMCWWAVAQTSLGSRLLDPSIQEELTALAMENPEQFAAEIELYKTPEDHLQRQLSHLGITNSAGYLRLFPKSTEQLANEATAREAVAHPMTVAESLNRMAPEERRKAEADLRAILNPPAFKE